jgi:hypothetical protein
MNNFKKIVVYAVYYMVQYKGGDNIRENVSYVDEMVSIYVRENVRNTVRNNVSIFIMNRIKNKYKPFKYNDLKQYKDNI